jgi:hypothetical protein
VSDSVWELDIRRRGDGGYRFTLSNSNVGGLESLDYAVPAGIRRDVLALARPPQQPDDFDGWVRELGTRICGDLLPKKIRDQLDKLDGGHLEISTDDADVPWELAWTEKGCLAKRVAAARRVEAPIPETQAAADAGSRLDVLVVSDPKGDLAGAAREGDEIKTMLGGDPLVQVTLVSGAEATVRRINTELSGRRFGLIHYAGHVRHTADDQSVFELSDGPAPADWLADKLSKFPPEVVFVNGCQSAAPGRADPDPDESGGLKTHAVAGMAERFLAVGVRGYVGTLWDVPDTAALGFATTFYSSLLNASTVGAAVVAARAAVDDRGAVGWAAHLLFGRPDDVLAGIQPAIQRRQRLRHLRDLLRSDKEALRRRAAIRLGELADPEATASLVEALDDDSPAVVWRSVLGLAKIGTPQALAALVERLPKAEPSLAVHMLVMLRERPSPDLAPAIRALVEQSPDRVVRANALITLGGTGDPANIEVLKRHLDDDDRLLQLLAIEGLGRIGRPALGPLYTYDPDDQTLETVRRRVVAEVERGDRD